MSFLFRDREPGTPDAPIPPAEMSRWDGVIGTMEELDKQAGASSKDTAAARSAFWGAVSGNRGRK